MNHTIGVIRFFGTISSSKLLALMPLLPYTRGHSLRCILQRASAHPVILWMYESGKSERWLRYSPGLDPRRMR